MINLEITYGIHTLNYQGRDLIILEANMAEIKRNSRNTLERRCISKELKRLYSTSSKGVWKMIEKVNQANKMK